jgi:DNA-binding CsgD family transcriptional regulator
VTASVATLGQAFSLTDREADVAYLLAEGLAPADIAKRLRMQTATARVHLRSIFEKTGTARQAELVALICNLRP